MEATVAAEEDYGEVYARNVKTVYRICMLKLRNAAEAEDATQNVFVNCIKRGTRFNDAEHEKAWFITAARNECRNAVKSRWRTRRSSLDEIEEPTCSDEIEAEQTALLTKLPDKYREVLYLYYYEGYKVEEIAAMLKRNANTVKTQLKKGRELIKIDMEGNYEAH